ncbi:SapC family protein [Halomonas sp. NYA30]
MPLDYQPISPLKHRNAGWKRPARYFYAADDVVAPVVMAELSHVLTSMPLAFVHADEEAPFQLVAVQSLQPGRNVYVAPDGRWLGQYIPAFYRSYPFRMLAIGSTTQTALCVDTSQGCFKEQCSDEDEPLFTDDGELSESLAAVKTFINAFEKNRLMTHQCVTELASAGVIEPWAVHLSHSESHVSEAESAQDVKGLHRINEAKLKALPAETLRELAVSGALSIAYAQLFSEQRLQHVGRRYRLHSEWQRHLSEQTNIEALLDEEDDDQLFDFGN